MGYTECRSFRKEQMKRRKRLTNKRKPKPDPILNQLADPDTHGRHKPKEGQHHVRYQYH